MSCSVFRRRRKKNPGADVAGCVTTLPLSGGSDHDAGATTFGTGRVRGRARVVESGRGRVPREGCGSGGDNVASAARARASAPRAPLANGKALSGEKPWKRGLPRARTCMRSARRSLRSRCACAECFSLDASRRTRRRFGRGEFGGESGPPTVDAPAARSDVASASAPASTSESLLPAGRHIDGRDTEVGIAVSNGKRRKRRTRATRGVLSLDASTRGRYCRGARPSRQSRSLRLGKRVQKKLM